MKRYISTFGLCELAVSAGVPISQSWAVMCMKIGACSKPIANFDGSRALVKSQIYDDHIHLKNISLETRMDFEAAFGIPVAAQLGIEEIIAGSQVTTPEFDSELSKYLLKYKNFFNY